MKTRYERIDSHTYEVRVDNTLVGFVESRAKGSWYAYSPFQSRGYMSPPINSHAVATRAAAAKICAEWHEPRATSARIK